MAELTTITFSDLSIWDVKNYFRQQDTFNESYPLVLFGEFLNKPIIKKTKIDDDNEYRILGVRSYGKGAYINRTVKGNTLKMRTYQIAPKDHLFWCKVDTKNGAFGIIDDNLANGVASSNMTFAEIDKAKANTEYVQLLFTSPKVNQYMDGYVTGTTNRKYIKPNQLLEEIKIPLPSLQEQKRIVSQYKQKIQLAQQQEQEANNLEQEIENYLYAVLKLNKNVVQQKEKGLQFTSLNQTSRWDTLFLIGNMPVLETSYPIKQFRDVVVKFNKGPENESIRINSKDYPNDEFVYIGMEHIEKETGNLLEVVKVKGEEIKSQTLRVPQDYLIYGKLRPYLNKYWINETSYDNIICSSEFFVFDIKTGINKQFFKYVLASSFIQQQITDKTSGARMPRINETIFYNLQFPLPDFNKQNEIADHIDGLKNQIKDLRKKANANREKALLNFEQEIFTA